MVASIMTAAIMIGVGAGTYVVGALRAFLSMEKMYLIAALYPAAAFVIAWFLNRSGRLQRPF
jgi:predicted MFS family arabinose efflux permease